MTGKIVIFQNSAQLACTFIVEVSLFDCFLMQFIFLLKILDYFCDCNPFSAFSKMFSIVNAMLWSNRVEVSLVTAVVSCTEKLKFCVHKCGNVQCALEAVLLSRIVEEDTTSTTPFLYSNIPIEFRCSAEAVLIARHYYVAMLYKVSVQHWGCFATTSLLCSNSRIGFRFSTGNTIHLQGKTFTCCCVLHWRGRHAFTHFRLSTGQTLLLLYVCCFTRVPLVLIWKHMKLTCLLS